MKSMVTLKSISAGERGDTLKFIDDATGQLPPTITFNGGARDGEKRTLKSARVAGEEGRLTLAIRGERDDGTKVQRDIQVAGKLTRTDAWAETKERGMEASAVITFAMDGRLEPEEIADLFSRLPIALIFEPAQKALPFKGAKLVAATKSEPSL